MRTTHLLRSLQILAAVSLSIAFTGCVQTKPAAVQWNRFRGPEGSGVARAARPPVSFGPASNVSWVAELPPGKSSPVVWEDKVFVTGIRDGAFETICLGAATGDVLWRTPGPSVEMEPHHPDNSPATSTPYLEEDRVYVYFGSYGVLCYDHGGEEIWRAPVVTPKNQHGTATSPVVHGDLLYLIHDSMDGDSYVLALHKQDGSEAWKAARAVLNPNWSTPVIWRGDGGDQLIVLGGGRVTAYDPLSGEELWALDGFGAPIPIPVVGERRIYASTVSGTQAGVTQSPLRWDYYGQFDADSDGAVAVTEIPEDAVAALDPENPEVTMPTRGMVAWVDRNRDQIMTREEFEGFLALTNLDVRSSIQAIEPSTTGAPPQVVWKHERSIPHMTSALSLDGRVYLVKRGGLVTCLDAETGSTIYFERVGEGSYTASPVAADGKIYIASQAGTITVFEAGDRPQMVAKNELGEPIDATPAISGDTLFVRTSERLYAFSDPVDAP